MLIFFFFLEGRRYVGNTCQAISYFMVKNLSTAHQGGVDLEQKVAYLLASFYFISLCLWHIKWIYLFLLQTKIP